MNFPFKINYHNGIAESVEYDLDVNYKNNDHSKNRYQIKESTLDLFCDFINSTDPYHLYYLYKKAGRIDDANDLISFAWHYKNELTQEESQNNEILLSNANFRTSLNIKPLPDKWIKNSRLIKMINRFQSEIFSFNVKYNIETGTLLFIDDPFLSTSIITSGARTLDKAYSDFQSTSPIDLAPLSIQFAYSPFQYQVRKRFSSLCESLRLEMISLIDYPIENSFFLSLYLQSKEFVLYHLEMLLRKYHPDSLIKNEYGRQKNNLSTLLNGFSYKDFDNRFVETYYSPILSDFLLSFAQNSQHDFLSILTDELMKEAYYCENDIEQNQDTIISNNRLINDIYFNCPKEEYIRSIDYSYILDSAEPSITISSIEYINCITHKKRVNTDAIVMPIPLSNYYNKDTNCYVREDIGILSVIYNDLSTPFLTPIFQTSDVNIQSYLLENDQRHHTHLYQATIDGFKKSDFSKNPFIKTDSLGTLICELLKASKSDGTGIIRRCAECHKFFVAKNGYEKYCDSPSREKGDPPKKETCSYKGKQKLEKNRNQQVRQIYNLKRNQHPRLDKSSDYFMDLKIDQRTDIALEYRKFIFFLKQNILLNDVYLKERAFICSSLCKENNQDVQKELKSYGRAFFPSNRDFKNDTVYNLPSSNSQKCVFFKPTRLTDIINTHITSFDWGNMISHILSSDIRPHEEYIIFRDKLIIASEQYTTLFDSLPIEITKSFEYLSSFDNEWHNLLSNTKITSATKRRTKRK